jgi:hypothetical protein
MRTLVLTVLAGSLIVSAPARADSSKWSWLLEVNTSRHTYIDSMPTRNKCQSELRELLIRPLTDREQSEQDADQSTKLKFAHDNGCSGYQIEPGGVGVRVINGDKYCHLPPCCEWSPSVYKDFKGEPVGMARCIQGIF